MRFTPRRFNGVPNHGYVRALHEYRSTWSKQVSWGLHTNCTERPQKRHSRRALHRLSYGQPRRQLGDNMTRNRIATTGQERETTRLHKRWASIALLLLGTTLVVPSAAADPFDWETVDVVRTTSFPQSQHEVEVRMGTDGAGDLEVQVAWRLDDEPQEATLLRTMCDDSAWFFHLAPDGSLVAQHGPCSRYDDHALRVHHTWRFEGEGGFVDETVGEHSPFSSGREAMRAALDAGHLADAWEIVGRIGTSPNGGHSDEGVAMFQELFDGTFTVAEEATNEGDHARAAEVMRWVFRRGIVCERDATMITVAAEPMYGGCDTNSLARTSENVARLEVAAERFEQVGDTSRAQLIRDALADP